jgi:hypothetical protein
MTRTEFLPGRQVDGGICRDLPATGKHSIDRQMSPVPGKPKATAPLTHAPAPRAGVHRRRRAVAGGRIRPARLAGRRGGGPGWPRAGHGPRLPLRRRSGPRRARAAHPGLRGPRARPAPLPPRRGGGRRSSGTCRKFRPVICQVYSRHMTSQFIYLSYICLILPILIYFPTKLRLKFLTAMILLPIRIMSGYMASIKASNTQNESLHNSTVRGEHDYFLNLRVVRCPRLKTAVARVYDNLKYKPNICLVYAKIFTSKILDTCPASSTSPILLRTRPKLPSRSTSISIWLPCTYSPASLLLSACQWV